MVLGAMGDVGQYIFCSSAGVYLKSHQMPHHEVDAVDPKSRHKVSLLKKKTSVHTGNTTCHLLVPPECNEVIHATFTKRPTVASHIPGCCASENTSGRCTSALPCANYVLCWHQSVSSWEQGKLDTEDLLEKKGVNWTSIRPVYIYGESCSLHARQ